MDLSGRARAVLLRALTVLALVGGGLGVAAPAAAGEVASPVVVGASGSLPVTAAAEDQPIELVRYTGATCAQCAEQSRWLEDVAAQYPGLTVVEREVWNDAANRALFVRAGEELGFEASSVPTTVLGDRVWIGWTGPVEDDLAAALAQAAAGKDVAGGVFGTPDAGTCSDDSLACSTGPAPVVIDVPLVGEVDLGGRSLLVSTVVIGFVDGVNPCSMWAISVLLTIVVRTGARRRVLAVGATFLTVTAAMYALYMAGIYSALSVATHLGAIQAVVAVVAGVFGAVAVKDYFAFKKGLSFSIADSAKPGLYRRMRTAAGHERLAPALLATAALGVAVSLLETPCTAGFPVLWTGMLQSNGVGPAEAVGLFGAYMVPFLLDELLIFGAVVSTMRAARLQEKHGQLLKLVAGVTMLALAGVMVLDPTLMENPVAALLVFVGAFVVTVGIHLVTQRVRSARGAPPDRPSSPARPTPVRAGS